MESKIGALITFVWISGNYKYDWMTGNVAHVVMSSTLAELRPAGIKLLRPI
jgi:hypothetical protein